MLFDTFIINLATLVLSFITISGLSIWKLEDDIYIYLYPHAYGFLWFLVIVTLFFSISVIGLTINKNSRMYIETELLRLGDLVYVFFTPVTFIVSICWLAITSNIIQITDRCFRFKRFMNEGFYNKFTCTGETIISVFGFALFIIYGCLFFFNAVKVYKMLIENYKYNQHTQNELEQQTTQEVQQPQEMQEILPRNSSLKQDTNIV